MAPFVPAFHVRRSGRGVLRQQVSSGRPRPLDQGRIALQIGEAQQRRARLPRAQELARPAHHKVSPRHLETVRRFVDHLQPLARHFGQRIVVQQDAEALLGATSHPAAQLVQLRQPESLGVFDHHQRRVRHIDADLDKERQTLARDLEAAGMVTAQYQVTGIGPTLTGRNGGGDLYYTDGEVWILRLVEACRKSTAPVNILPSPLATQIKDAMWREISDTMRN